MNETAAAPAAAAAATAAEQARTGPVVSARDLTRRYGQGDTAVDALRGVSLDVPRGQMTAVMGPSGSGKSTLMHILAGLDKPTSGEVEIAGTPISKLSDTELTKLRREHIGFIFQFFNLLPMLTAEENVVLPLTLAGEKPDKGWMDDLMQKVGLADRRKHRPSELSGGQRQRVAIARAIVCEPTIILADEPTANLDHKTGETILSLLEQLNRERKTAIVIATHDHRVISFARRTVSISRSATRSTLSRGAPRRSKARSRAESSASANGLAM